MAILSAITGLFGGSAGKIAEKATEGIIDGFDALIYTAEEEARDNASEAASSRLQQLKQLKLLLESEKVMNQETNVILRLLQKSPRIIGGNAVMIWFAWNLFLHTMPGWAAVNGYAPYTPTGEMATLLMVIFGAVWMTRTIEKKMGVSNK